MVLEICTADAICESSFKTIPSKPVTLPYYIPHPAKMQAGFEVSEGFCSLNKAKLHFPQNIPA